MALYFEGDDTYGATEEKATYEKLTIDGVERYDSEHFFVRWGMAPKIEYKAETGYDYCRFVGFDSLILDGEFVYEGAGNTRRLVMQPDFKRILSTKSWTLQDAPRVALKFATRTYARSYGNDFRHNEPAHAFMQALFDQNELSMFERLKLRTLRLQADLIREVAFRVGTVGAPTDLDGILASSLDDELWNAEFPPLLGSLDSDRHLTRLAVGPFSALEWATACAPPSMDVHGADLANHFPRSWT
jgi:hypothetical protein